MSVTCVSCSQEKDLVAEEKRAGRREGMTSKKITEPVRHLGDGFYLGKAVRDWK